MVKNMLLLPAIDLMDNRCVRLRQGRADDVTVYNNDPVEQARIWEAQGGDFLHVVDLDGAFAGEPRHTDLIARMVAAIKIPVEVGGGLRTDQDVRQLLDVGVTRVILGTRAAADPPALQNLAGTFGAGIAVGIDARDGLVQVRGWVETTTTRAIDLARHVASLGVRTVIYTDTATDGMLKGANIKGMQEMCDAVPELNFVASGGVTGTDDIRALAALQRPNLEGAIIGRALYENTTTLAELKAAMRPAPII